jgi:pentatricopeptide repeat protein
VDKYVTVGLITAYAEHKQLDSAYASFTRLRAQGPEHCDKAVYTAMMYAYARAGIPEKAEELFQVAIEYCTCVSLNAMKEMVMAGIEPDIQVYNVRMSAYANVLQLLPHPALAPISLLAPFYPSVTSTEWQCRQGAGDAL